MKRFINLSDQILPGTKEFAWWDTVRDRFEQFSGEQSWETTHGFAEAFICSEYNRGNTKTQKELDRYLKLIPRNWGS